MRGDFSRDTYEKGNGFSRVVYQQGRDLVDADFNEQAAIYAERLRALADAVIPWPGKGSSKPDVPFTVDAKVRADGKALDVTLKGWYFTSGFLLDFGEGTTRSLPAPDDTPVALYLGVYEQTVHPAMQPELLEPALDPRDTALRRKVAWTVQGLPVNPVPDSPTTDAEFRAKVLDKANPKRSRPGPGNLKAKIDLLVGGEADRCAPRADDTFQGVENQLYRAEIHAAAASGADAQFKWSRDNAAVGYAVDNYYPTGSQSLKVALKQPAPDNSWALAPGDWVELVGKGPPAPAGLADDPFGAPLPLLADERRGAAGGLRPEEPG
jgi:hypothetical protein